jgi:cell division protein FtsZ
MDSKMQASKYADLKPRIVVIGVGGGGGNAVNNMVATGLTGAKFIVANTDAQALSVSGAEYRIQLGARLTEGIGAGAKPEIGEAAAEEALEEIRAALAGAHMVFIAAGMGGGTGTGAASVIARVAKEFGILAVAVVTKPFTFEGKRRMRVAEAGIAELKRHVDTLLVIPNQNLFKIANDRTAFAEAFLLADRVLYSGVACIVDLVVKEGLINLDLADVKSVLSGMGTAMMGTGEASGEQRAVDAARAAVVNPLLDDVTLRGAKSLLLSISGGSDLTLFEVHDAVDYVREQLDTDANIIFGATLDESLVGRIRVSIVASGMARSDTLPVHGRNERPPAADPRAGQDFRDRLSQAIGGYGHQDAPPAHNAGRRDAWQGPGDVVIRDDNAGRDANPRAHRPEDRPLNGGNGRSMPAVEDFPPVAQREYWAKASDVGRAAGRSHQQPVDPPQRRPGLLQRLTGVGRDKRAESNRRDRSSAYDDNGAGSHGADEQVDLPVFFGRGKRS